jgi:hypothetical protein
MHETGWASCLQRIRKHIDAALAQNVLHHEKAFPQSNTPAPMANFIGHFDCPRIVRDAGSSSVSLPGYNGSAAYSSHTQNFLGFVQLACLVILFRQF